MIKKNKKAISAMIGYVLLVAFAVVMGGLIYNWMKSYVPQDSLECPDSVSFFINDLDCESSSLNITLRNNGRFNVAGYFIHGTNETGQVATIDLSQNLVGGIKLGSTILFAQGNDNTMKPGEEKKSEFSLVDEINFIEIIPVRFEIVENKKRIASCGNAKIVEEIDCSVEVEEEEIPVEEDEGCVDDEDCEDAEVCVEEVCQLCGNGGIEGEEECDGTDNCTNECICEGGYFSLEGICTST